MQAQKQGDYYVVTVEPEEVAEFAARWPCSGLDTAAGKEFQFSARTGDIVDLASIVDGARASTEDEDGPALAALSEDAMLFGARELGLTDVLAIRDPEPPGGPRP